MPTRTVRSLSTCSLAGARPSATARSTALRASGRLIVTIATADSICSVTSGIDLDSMASARRHPQCAIETDGLAVEHRVFDDLRCHQRELVGMAESCRMRHRFAQRGAHFIGHACEQRRSEEHTSELTSLMRISYAVCCLTKKKKHKA